MPPSPAPVVAPDAPGSPPPRPAPDRATLEGRETVGLHPGVLRPGAAEMGAAGADVLETAGVWRLLGALRPSREHETQAYDRAAAATTEAAGPSGAVPAPPDAEGEAGSDAATEPRAPRFTLLRPIAHGGMGEVWEARQESLRRLVAVKRVRTDVVAATAPGSSDRRALVGGFCEEALITARLEHPNILPVHDLGTDDDGLPLLAMKRVEGTLWSDRILEDELTCSGADLLARHVPILLDVAQAVAYAHEQGIVHRDIKPAQVMVGRHGETLLMDWGLAVYVGRTGSRADADGAWSFLPTIDRATSPAGTPALMAPEQAEFDASGVGPWTDVYLLGGTLYFLLTGSFPHETADRRRAMERARAGDIDAPARRAPGRHIPSELADLALRALRPDPRDRVPSAEAFIAALEAWRTGATQRAESERLATNAWKLHEAEARDAARAPAAPPDPLAAYARQRRVADLCLHALRLWPDNPRALALHARGLAERAAFATSHGDLLLARHLLDDLATLGEDFVPPATRRSLAAGLAAAQRRRRNLRRTLRGLAAAALFLLAASLALATLAWRQATLAGDRAAEAEVQRAIALDLQGRGARLVDFLLGDLRDALDLSRPADRHLATVLGDSVVASLSAIDASELAPDLHRRLAAQRLRVGRHLLDLDQVAHAERLLLLADRSLLALDGERAPERPALLLALAHIALRRGDRDAVEAHRAAVERLAPLRDADAIALEGLLALRDQIDGRRPEALARHEARAASPSWRRLADSLDDDDRALLLEQTRAQAELLTRAGRLPEAARLLGGALDRLAAPASRRDGIERLRLLTARGRVLVSEGDFTTARDVLEEALAASERLLGPDHSTTAFVLDTLADAVAGLGDGVGALDLSRRAALLLERSLGADHQAALAAGSSVVTHLLALERFDEARAALEELLPRQMAVLGADHPDVAATLNGISHAHFAQGRLAEAEDFLARALALNVARLGEEDEAVATMRKNHAVLLAELGRFDEALAEVARARATSERLTHPRHSSVANALMHAAAVREKRGDLAAALRDLDEALAILLDEVGAQHQFTAFILEARARVLEGLGRLDEALDSQQRAHEARRALHPPASRAIARSAAALAALHADRAASRDAAGDPRGAEADLTAARALLAGLPDEIADPVRARVGAGPAPPPATTGPTSAPAPLDAAPSALPHRPDSKP